LTTPIVAGATLSGTITSTATISGGTLTGAIVTGLTSSSLADTQATPKNYVDAILVLQTASQTAAATSAASAATSATSAANSATAAATFLSLPIRIDFKNLSFTSSVNLLGRAIAYSFMVVGIC
jgi:hypothetical protein